MNIKVCMLHKYRFIVGGIFFHKKSHAYILIHNALWSRHWNLSHSDAILKVDKGRIG